MIVTAAALKVPYVDIPGQHAPLLAELAAAAAGVIERGQFILGPEVGEFERRFAALCGTRFALGVNSGGDALALSLRALGIGPGDEVITAPNSFIASASCVVQVGARPVFVDVREDYNLDPGRLEAAITSKTRAIFPVHLTGRPADMEPLLKVAGRHGLRVIEDAAQAVLAEYRGQRVGSIGALGCFSLHPLKTLNACGDGGVVTTNDEALYQRLALLRNFGLKSRENAEIWGVNSRLDTLQAALLLVKLKRLERWTEQRRSHAAYYQQALAGIPGVRVPSDQPYEKAVYHTFIIQAERRDELKAFLLQEGIGTAIHYPIPIHLQTAAAGLGYGRGSFPEAERQAGRILSLPVYPELTTEQLQCVAGAVRKFYAA